MSTQSDRVSNLTLANAEALAREEGGGNCKWQKVGCPGFLDFRTYEACLISGNGHDCSCGETTRDC